MRILLDHCVDRRLKRLLSDYEVKTAREMSWESIKNGVLLALAAAEFDVMLTVDQNIKHQQNLTKLPLAIVVMVATVNNRFETLASYIPEVKEVLSRLRSGEYVEVHKPKDA